MTSSAPPPLMAATTQDHSGAAVRRAAAGRRVTVSDIAAAKARGEKWPMLTAYDALTAGIFDEAGIPVLLVGDSAGKVVFGYETTIPVTVDDLIPLTAAVVRGTSRAMVVADLPFGSYQASPGEALHAAARFMKEAGAHAVKLEGGQRVAPPGRGAGRGGHPGDGPPRPDPAVGATPSAATGCRDAARTGERLLHDAKALRGGRRVRRGARGRPAALAAQVTEALRIPTIGIGAGPDCDAQVLVWQDMAGPVRPRRRSSSSSTPTWPPSCATPPPTSPPTSPAAPSRRGVLLPVGRRPKSQSTALVFRTDACFTCPGRRFAGRPGGRFAARVQPVWK